MKVRRQKDTADAESKQLWRKKCGIVNGSFAALEKRNENRSGGRKE